MKINKLIVAALSAALIFTACSKEEGIDGSGKQAAQASINVKFDLSKTRAIDPIDVPTGLEQDFVTIKEAIVYLIEGTTGKIADCADVPNLADLTGAGLTFNDEDKITTAISEVIVITNGGFDPAELAILKGYTNKSQLLAHLNNLSDLNANYKTKSKITSYGEATIASSDWGITEIPGENDDVTIVSKANVAITEVNPILSRVDFIVDVSAATGWYVEGDLLPDDESYVVMKGVALLYSAAQTAFVSPFTTSITGGLLSGIIPGGESEWYDTPRATATLYGNEADENFLYGSWSAAGNFDDGINKFSRSFYALSPNDMYPGANASLKAKPIITAYAERFIWDDEAGDGEGAFKEETEMIFWPIHFDGVAEYGSTGALTMENGNRYVINIKLLGDLSNKENHNTGTPETYYLANVKVTVSEAKWKAVVSIDETFGNEEP